MLKIDHEPVENILFKDVTFDRVYLPWVRCMLGDKYRMLFKFLLSGRLL